VRNTQICINLKERTEKYKSAIQNKNWLISKQREKVDECCARF